MEDAVTAIMKTCDLKFILLISTPCHKQ